MVLFWDNSKSTMFKEWGVGLLNWFELRVRIRGPGSNPSEGKNTTITPNY